MRYLGNKTKLLPFIKEVINKYDIEGKVFVDLFAGTGSVGDYFKDKYKIIANDFMYYSYVINIAKLFNKSIPSFDKFEKRHSQNIFDWLNHKTYEPSGHFFIYNNYTPVGGRMFFTEENGLKIDGTRITIEELYKEEVISKNEYFFLIASLLESVTKVSNTSGTYEAFFKFWESRASKSFIMEPLDFIHSSFDDKNEVYREESNLLNRNIQGDIMYIDPPYTVTQYASAYHVLETIAKYDLPLIKGVGGKREKGECVSLYSRKQFAIEQFEDLFRQAQCRHILVSYSNQSIVPLEELIELAKIFSIDNAVYIEKVKYTEYQNHRSSNKRNGATLKEVIIYFEKDLSFAKSPLNYSGSKDTLLPSIIKELPDHIGIFVDVMGGAFNVGANIFTTDKVIYNDNNPFVYEIINWLLKTNPKEKIKVIETIIDQFKISKGSKNEYLKLRDFFNNECKTPEILYVLHMYSFQNIIRFNGDKKFNTPVGVAGYSNDIKNRIENFKPKNLNIELFNSCYTKINWDQYPLDTLFYFDPPYFITNASYNDGKRGLKGWNGDLEVELLNILTKLNKNGYKFILSNVIYHKGKTNHILLEWVNEHDFKIIDIGSSGWRYAKDEVLIKNF